MAKLRIGLVENQILDDKDCLIAITKGLQADEWAAIIVAALNERERLREALRELLNQFYPHKCERGRVCKKCESLVAGSQVLND